MGRVRKYKSVIRRKAQSSFKKKQHVKNKSSNGDFQVPPGGFESKLNTDAGFKLPENTRSYLERRFGADFSFVKIHTDTRASQMNKLLNSRAFTFGNDIYFDKGKYNPNTNKGMHLLAHELAHVIQQADRIQTKIIQKSEEAEPPKNATDEDTCSGWDKDPESLTIAAAKHYFKEEFDKDIMVKSVKCDASSEIIMCTLTLEDGSIVNVHFNPKRNIVRVQFKDSSGTMKHCRYNYSCNTDGTIVFTKISCG